MYGLNKEEVYLSHSHFFVKLEGEIGILGGIGDDVETFEKKEGREERDVNVL